MTPEKPWLSFSDYCKSVFGRRLYRIALDAGMTCPNRDGTLGTRGCIFCDEGGSGDFAIRYEGKPLTRADFSHFHHSGAGDGDFIAYFQSFTNTYAPASRLEFLFESALKDPVFAGISVATRPDCLGGEVLTLLSELKARHPDKFIWLELGLQTGNDKTAAFIRRGYLTRVFLDAAEKLREIGIPFIVHVILGLPGETRQDILDTIDVVNRSGAFGVKLQLLHILKGTDLGRLYEDSPESVPVLDFDTYVDLIADCLAVLSPDIVVMRLTGDGAPNLLLAPGWSRNKRAVLNGIRHALKVKGFVQGLYFKPESAPDPLL